MATLHLTINHSTTSDETQVACDSYTWNGTTYTTSGDKTFTSTNVAGCTNVATLHLTINHSYAPVADADQTFNLGDTLTNLIIASGSNLTWYDSQTSTTSIPNTTTLIDGTTYYVSQTINGCEGPKTAITVHLNLGVDQNELVTITYNPNPVIDILVIKSKESIETITVFNTLGQLLFTKQENVNEFSVDFSNLPTGNYFIRTQRGDKNQVLKVIKK